MATLPEGIPNIDANKNKTVKVKDPNRKWKILFWISILGLIGCIWFLGSYAFGYYSYQNQYARCSTFNEINNHFGVPSGTPQNPGLEACSANMWQTISQSATNFRSQTFQFMVGLVLTLGVIGFIGFKIIGLIGSLRKGGKKN